jgi:membrane protein implicated in regulation of membrane protease activity
MITWTSDIVIFPKPVLGTVENSISSTKKGRVKYDGTYWPASFYQSSPSCIQANEPIWVIGRQGLTLLVVPMS